MRPIIASALLLAACAACAATTRTPAGLQGPALLPHEAPAAHDGDITVRATGVSLRRPETADRGASFEAAVSVGVGSGLSLGVAHTLRVQEHPNPDFDPTDAEETEDASELVRGNEDLRLLVGWQGTPTAGVALRVLAETWLPTHADVFDADHPDARARLSGALALHVHRRGWFWLAPAIEGTRDEPRTFEGGLELGVASAPWDNVLLSARAGAHQRYLPDDADVLAWSARVQAAWRCERIFYLLEAEVGDRSPRYRQLTLAVGLRTKLW